MGRVLRFRRVWVWWVGGARGSPMRDPVERVKKVRVLHDAGESIILFFIIIIIISIIFFMYGYSEPVSLSCVQCARGHRPK